MTAPERRACTSASHGSLPHRRATSAAARRCSSAAASSPSATGEPAQDEIHRHEGVGAGPAAGQLAAVGSSARTSSRHCCGVPTAASDEPPHRREQRPEEVAGEGRRVLDRARGPRRAHPSRAGPARGRPTPGRGTARAAPATRPSISLSRPWVRRTVVMARIQMPSAFTAAAAQVGVERVGVQLGPSARRHRATWAEHRRHHPGDDEGLAQLVARGQLGGPLEVPAGRLELEVEHARLHREHLDDDLEDGEPVPLGDLGHLRAATRRGGRDRGRAESPRPARRGRGAQLRVAGRLGQLECLGGQPVGPVLVGAADLAHQRAQQPAAHGRRLVGRASSRSMAATSTSSMVRYAAGQPRRRDVPRDDGLASAGRRPRLCRAISTASRRTCSAPTVAAGRHQRPHERDPDRDPLGGARLGRRGRGSAAPGGRARPRCRRRSARRRARPPRSTCPRGGARRRGRRRRVVPSGARGRRGRRDGSRRPPRPPARATAAGAVPGTPA